MIKGWIDQMVRMTLRHALWVSLLGAVLSGLGTWFSVQLYKNLRTDIEELLPTSARSVRDLSEISSRLKSTNNLAILIFSDQPSASKRFVDDLTQKIDAVNEPAIASLEYRIKDELEFFTKRSALYLSTEDLTRIRDYISEKIHYEKALYNPLNIFSEVEIPEPQLDFNAMKMRYQSRTSSYSRYPDGYYATPDEKKRVILVQVSGKSIGFTTAMKVKGVVDQAISELNPASYDPQMTIRFSGNLQQALEEHHALIEDLELSTIVVMVLVTGVVALYFHNFFATLLLMLSLVMGTLWTFGASYFAVGYLNANSAFLGSIVLGNGINFGIIFLARYLEERRKGKEPPRSIWISVRSTAFSTLTAALAAGLSYGSLVLTGFRGFNQFGIIGLIGMVLCWLSALVLLPAFVLLWERMRPLIRSGSPLPKSPLAGATAKLIYRYPGVITALTALVTVLCTAIYVQKNPFRNPDIFETNIGSLRNRYSLEEGAGYLSKYLDEIFQRYLTPAVLLPLEREDAREIARRIREKIVSDPGFIPAVVGVQTLDDFLPTDQEKKVRVIREIRALITPKILRRMSVRDRDQVAELLGPEVDQVMREAELPRLLLDKFTEKDGSMGNLVVVEPSLGGELRQGPIMKQFVAGLREIADSVAPGTALATQHAITADMLVAIGVDGPRATFFAFIAVCLLVVILFRNLATSITVLGALILGIFWLGGLILWKDYKINFLNFIALPITFGIGVDYGVNIFQRYREEGSGSMLEVIRSTGGAVALCSLTTIIGYGSLLIASSRAFVSFGLLAVLGELTCIVAAIFSVPALLLVVARWKERKTGPQKL